MSKLKEFVVGTARPLPVILLADVSGSMSTNGKIDVLNDSIEEMLRTFASEDDHRAEIHVATITFGKNGGQLHQALTPAGQTSWQRMTAAGATPLGAALNTALQLIEDRQQIPSRSYSPTLILVSDGQPTDDWQQPLQDLLSSPRGSKASRFALGIGDDADMTMLSAFLADPNGKVFSAQDVRQIKKFFKWVTMSVTERSRSVNPDSFIPSDPIDFDEDVF
ncbi:MAG: VWA domain-containing protein [Deltaproteobacteria bacterium]|nr:MAG: VWA domain-containing protein [Deltaproteobacteria bacterium]